MQHRGLIVLTNQDGKEYTGKVKICTNKLNTENYLHISDTVTMEHI